MKQVWALPFSAALVIPTWAAERPLLNVRVGELHTAINDFARENDLRVRAVKTTCSAGAVSTCQYAISDTMQLLAVGQTPESSAREITVVYGSNKRSAGTAAEALLVYTALIATLSPKADVHERGQVIRTLMGGLSTNQKEGTAELQGVRYSVSAMEGMGVWFFAKPSR